MAYLDDHDIYCNAPKGPTPGCKVCDMIMEQARIDAEEEALEEALESIQPGRVDIRRDDHEPVYDHQVGQDRLSAARTRVCTDPGCCIKLAGHRHKV